MKQYLQFFHRPLVSVLLGWQCLTGSLGLLASAQAATLDELLSGRTVPLTLKLKDLSNDWRRMTISSQAMSSNFAEILSAVLPGTAAGVYYTHGQTVIVGSETYLVVYRIPLEKPDLTALLRTGANAPPCSTTPITAETTVVLSLLNLRTVSSFNEVQPFNLIQELKTVTPSSFCTRPPSSK
ncbi:hypothetical protein DO97_14650 [Neosynechococcus sphagnicola sy1]|uniref:Uncharacterized protein n=1 Tax=Neosynechococcus sphagnicola sy1 TaxID=1497020 RepID=A0A098TM06_9CYAN|nr:hypothetical protein [Neosynechococcus sphagnicola]KGF71873.1 hypothetical protein DO97_14650 [Neosynechococcus sphagnicola sy1]